VLKTCTLCWAGKLVEKNGLLRGYHCQCDNCGQIYRRRRTKSMDDIGLPRIPEGAMDYDTGGEL
jgi:hypothetical protein